MRPAFIDSLPLETQPITALLGPDLVAACGKPMQRGEGAVRVAGKRGFHVAGFHRLRRGGQHREGEQRRRGDAAGANPVPSSGKGGIQLTQYGCRHGDLGVAAGPHGRDAIAAALESACDWKVRQQ